MKHTIERNEKFKKLSRENQQKVLKALESGRVYLSDNTNWSEKLKGLHYTMVHFGKMKNLISISTSVLDNDICQQRRKVEGSVCSKCFAAAQMKCYKNMQPIFKKNLDVLRDRLLKEEEIPVILTKSGLFRFESFGDVCSVTQAMNYFMIAHYNPWLKCAVWTKNLRFYRDAIIMMNKPKNLNIVYSSAFINQCGKTEDDFVDRIFTVYDADCIEKNHININCGAISCASCRKCYEKVNEFIINEKLK